MNIIISFFVIIVVVIAMLLGNNIPLNWYLFPMIIGGAVSLAQIIRYLKRPDYLRDALFYFWIVMFITAFIAPLIHFGRDSWVEHVYLLPANWEALALNMSVVLLYGILLTSLLETIPRKTITQQKLWQYKPNAKIVIIWLMVISFGLQTFFYLRSGGIAGVIQAYTERDTINSGNFAGYGLYFIFSEMFPYLMLLLFYINRKDKKTTFIHVVIFLVLMFVSALYFGGLRGSRSNTILTMFQAILLIHFTIYKFRKIHFAGMLIAFFAFMIVGRIYKSEGRDFIDNYSEYRDYTISKNMSAPESIITTDLTRYDDVSYLIYMFNNNPYYKYKYGETYLSSTLTFIPLGKYVIDFFDIKGRSQAAGELMFNYDGQERTSSRRNSRIFGFIGEAMLNFGYFSFIFSFFILYLIINRIRIWSDSISINDARFYFISLLPIVVINLVDSDSNNVVFFIVKRIVLMYIIISLITTKTKNIAQ